MYLDFTVVHSCGQWPIGDLDVVVGGAEAYERGCPRKRRPRFRAQRGGLQPAAVTRMRVSSSPTTIFRHPNQTSRADGTLGSRESAETLASVRRPSRRWRRPTPAGSKKVGTKASSPWSPLGLVACFHSDFGEVPGPEAAGIASPTSELSAEAVVGRALSSSAFAGVVEPSVRSQTTNRPYLESSVRRTSTHSRRLVVDRMRVPPRQSSAALSESVRRGPTGGGRGGRRVQRAGRVSRGRCRLLCRGIAGDAGPGRTGGVSALVSVSPGALDVRDGFGLAGHPPQDLRRQQACPWGLPRHHRKRS